MLSGAILVVGQCSWDSGCDSANNGYESTPILGGSPIASVELLGRSVLDRTIQALRLVGTELITVIASEAVSSALAKLANGSARVRLLPPTMDLMPTAEDIAREYVDQGVENILLGRVGPYAEINFADLLQCHRERTNGLTSVTSSRGELDLLVIDADRVVKNREAGRRGLSDIGSFSSGVSYSVPGYVNFLHTARDLRRFVSDAFLGRCAVRPSGEEVRPGVWFGQGVHVHRDARVVAPAYVGCGTTIRAGAFITQCSVLERDCEVAEGTLIENSVVLSNSFVGKGLSVSHAVVNGNKLVPLRRNVLVEVEDRHLLGRVLPVKTQRFGSEPSAELSLAERLLATAWS